MIELLNVLMKLIPGTVRTGTSGWIASFLERISLDKFNK